MSTNINTKANLIWEVATKLVGVYKPHEYGNKATLKWIQ